MAWTGFGGTWTDGEHHGGDSSGSIGGGGIKLDSKGNPVGARAPTATDIANQYNSIGGTQISPSFVSNIRSDGEGGYTADIAGAYTSVSSVGAPRVGTTLSGFTGIVTPDSNGGKGVQGGMSNWNDAINAVGAGKIPSNFKLQGGKIGIMAPKYRRISTGHGESYQQQIGEGFVEVPALTKAYQEGVKERTEMQEAIKLTSDFYKEVGLKYGAKQSAIAQELAAASKGKAMKNVDQAMAAFTKNQAILDANLSVSTREAIANTLQSANRAQIAKNLNLFGKGFGLVGISMDLYDLGQSLQTSIKTNNWRPFFVKATAMLLAQDASILTAWAFSAMLGLPLGIVGYALIMAAVSALVNEDLVNKAVNTLVK